MRKYSEKILILKILILLTNFFALLDHHHFFIDESTIFTKNSLDHTYFSYLPTVHILKFMPQLACLTMWRFFICLYLVFGQHPEVSSSVTSSNSGSIEEFNKLTWRISWAICGPFWSVKKKLFVGQKFSSFSRGIDVTRSAIWERFRSDDQGAIGIINSWRLRLFPRWSIFVQGNSRIFEWR